MSSNELRVMKIVTFLLHLCNEGHFKLYRPQVENLLWGIHKVYHRPGTGKEQIRIYRSLMQTENELINMNLNTNLSMLFTALMELAERYLMVTTTPARVEAWSALLDYCSSNEIMQHISRKMLTDSDIQNMHIGNEVAAVIARL